MILSVMFHDTNGVPTPQNLVRHESEFVERKRRALMWCFVTLEQGLETIFRLVG